MTEIKQKNQPNSNQSKPIQTVGVIGLGYVGLPLVIDFCQAGLKVTGFDIDSAKVEALSSGQSYISYIPAATIAAQVESGRLTATTDFALLTNVEAIIIAVPTPLNRHREPDLSFVEKTSATIAAHLKPGQLVALESTTYPGTTTEVVLPLLEQSGLKAGADFYLAYSPERVDPNNQAFEAKNIPKVVGGYTPACLEKATELYSHVFNQVVPVSSPAVAEASKLLENIFRSVNIALVNELKMLFDRMGINIWEVIAASSTKPFGFMPFQPGPGLGGHCLPIDPFYLTWKAREFDFSTRFIELAGEINSSMPYYVLHKTIEALNARGKSINNASVMLLGVAYKKDVDDIRESPAVKLIELFRAQNAKVSYHDPYIPRVEGLRAYPGLVIDSTPLTAANLSATDCVVIITDHSQLDYNLVTENAPLVIDTRNTCQGTGSNKIIRA